MVKLHKKTNHLLLKKILILKRIDGIIIEYNYCYQFFKCQRRVIMRKIISTILVLTMVLSLFSFSVSAEHWADDAINFVTENGYWISSSVLSASI